MSQKKSIKRNYIYNVSYQILSLITPLITTPYISHVLNRDLVGDYSFTASIVTYFSMIAVLGTFTYGNREISYLQTDRRKRSQMFWDIEFLSCITTAICTLAFLVFLCFCPHYYFSLYAIQIGSILCIATDIGWLLQGMEDFQVIVGRNFIFKILNIAFIFLLVKKEDDILLYVGGMVILALLSNLSLWISLPKYVDAPDFHALHPLKHLKPTFILFIPSVAISIYTVMDKSMIGFFSTAAENSYYEQALKISRTALTLVTSLGAVMIPRMGYHFQRKETEELNRLVYQSYNFTWFLGLPICFGLIGITPNLVPWFYGPQYEKITLLLPVLSLLVPIIGFSNVTGIQYFVTTKRESFLTRTVCIGAATNFVLNLILIPRFASVGASIASALAELTISLSQFYFIRKELSFFKVIRMSFKYLLAGLGMLGLLYLENQYLSASVLHTFFMIVSGGLCYFVLLYLLRDVFLLQYTKQFTQKILSKLKK